MARALSFVLACPVAFALLLPVDGSAANSPDGSSVPGAPMRSDFLKVGLSEDRDTLLFLAVDSLGQGKVDQNILSAPRPSQAHNPGWSLEAGASDLRLSSSWSPAVSPAPLSLTIDTRFCYGTLLGLFNSEGAIELPAVLHLPGYGTLRVTSTAPGGSLGYAAGPGWVRVSFPPATETSPASSYRLEATTICPPVRGIGDDRRFDGFRRNWLNVLQLNPSRRMLSNNTSSDTVGFCYYEYADIARETPPLAEGLYALDLVRQTLDRVLSGTKTYGMPGYGDFPVESSDTFPSLLIAAADYVEGRQDWAWLRTRYPEIRAMADRMVATDTSGDGLIKYAASGNSGTWNEGQPKVRPSNWWDTIGFGYEDAYSNALAYRALLGMKRMAQGLHARADADRYGAAASKLHDAYFRTFYNPSTGILAGWKSADGSLHDYYFLFVNGIAVLYGLAPEDKAAGIMDRLWDKMEAAGYTNFRMGLPGNLVPVPRRDYAHKDPRYGGGIREDNADGFQIYENGGATACFSYFSIAALYKVGQRARADQILFPILDAFEQREFEGTEANHKSNDWRKWDGTAEGYEGFLSDNYYTLLAVTGR